MTGSDMSLLRLPMARLELATTRIRKATNSPDEAEMFHAAADFLDSLYPVTRHFRDADSTSYDEACRSRLGGRTVAGLTWLRGQQVHQLVQAGSFIPDAVADHYYDHFGQWTWRADLPDNGEPLYGLYLADISGREVLPTVDLATEFVVELAT